MASPLRGQDTSELIAAQFEKSAALITVGVSQVVLTARPEGALVGFRDLMNRLWTIVQAGGQERILVWVLDPGKRDFEDPESRTRFVNVDALISRFTALTEFKEDVTEDRWNWLRSRAVIALHDTRSVSRDAPRVACLRAAPCSFQRHSR